MRSGDDVGQVVGQVTAAVTYGNDLDVPGFGDGFSIAVIFLLCAIVPTALVLPFLPALHEPECRGADVRNVLVEVIATVEMMWHRRNGRRRDHSSHHHVLVEVIARDDVAHQE